MPRDGAAGSTSAHPRPCGRVGGYIRRVAVVGDQQRLASLQHCPGDTVVLIQATDGAGERVPLRLACVPRADEAPSGIVIEQYNSA